MCVGLAGWCVGLAGWCVGLAGWCVGLGLVRRALVNTCLESTKILNPAYQGDAGNGFIPIGGLCSVGLVGSGGLCKRKEPVGLVTDGLYNLVGWWAGGLVLCEHCDNRPNEV